MEGPQRELGPGFKCHRKLLSHFSRQGSNIITFSITPNYFPFLPSLFGSSLPLSALSLPPLFPSFFLPLSCKQHPDNRGRFLEALGKWAGTPPRTLAEATVGSQCHPPSQQVSAAESAWAGFSVVQLGSGMWKPGGTTDPHAWCSPPDNSSCSRDSCSETWTPGSRPTSADCLPKGNLRICSFKSLSKGMGRAGVENDCWQISVFFW